ncbi:hypothetical protein JXB41_07300 [Candidatus Woesearchaeota archaeon]|nr:hypothetical protein [Candidatus Woesearchaeota archaeon]
MPKNKITILILSIMLFSLIPSGAFSQQNQPVAVQSDEASPAAIRSHIRTQLKDAESVDDCVRKAKTRFPGADPARLRNECTEFLHEAAQLKKANAQQEATTGRQWLAKTVAEKAPEWRLKAAERLADAQPKVKEFIGSLDEESAEKFIHLSNAEKARILAMNAPAAAAKLAKLKLVKINKEMQFKKRVIAEQKLVQAEKKFQQAKQKYVQAQTAFQKAKKAFDDAVAQGDEEAAKEHAKEFLVNTADMILSALEKIKENVEGNDDLTEEEASEIIADLDEKIKLIEDAKADVEAAETKDEIKAAGKVILDAWERMKHRIRLHAARIIKSKVSDVLGRAEALERKLEQTMARLEEQGYDVSGADDLVDEFGEKIAEAKDKFNEAKEKFDEARDLTDDESTQEEIDELVSEGKQLVREAHDLLKEAHTLLKEIVKEIKGIDPEVDLEEESAEDEYEVVDEENTITEDDTSGETAEEEGTEETGTNETEQS